MKIFKKIILIFLSFITVFTIAILCYLQYLKPNYSGKIKLPNIKKTEVYFDSIGVPHIFADTEKNALTALGYVHAQDRLWQMELLRRIASGRLSEILGADLLETDVFFCSLGIDETVKKQLLNLNSNPHVKKLANAYLDGINHYITHGKTPIEFTLLGIQKETYTLKDMYYVSAYTAFSFAHAFKTDPVLSHIKNKYGVNHLNDLDMGYDFDPNTKENEFASDKKTSLNINAILNKIPFPTFIGSNGWVLSATKTTTGKVILENDPHIGFAQPCVWYQAHIKTPDYENYGFYLGLMPFPLLAHNRNHAFGITMFENDDIDFYEFKNHPTDSTQYITSSGTNTFEYIDKTIKIKGAESKTIQIKKTILGTKVDQVVDGLHQNKPIALQWVYHENPPKVLQTAYDLNHAKNMREFEQATSKLSAPGLNFVYGDINNHIGVWSAGKLYKHRKEVNTKFILNGLNDKEVVKQQIPFTENPKTVNPLSGYVSTSNTQPAAVNGVFYTGYYLPQDRAIAIKNGITAKQKLSVATVKSLAKNHTNITQVKNVSALALGLDLEALSEHETTVLDVLLKWKGNHRLESVEPAIYYKLMFTLLKNTFKDELGETYFKDFVNTNLCKRTQNKFLTRQNSLWWDDVNTPNKETFSTIVTKSFKQSVQELTSQLGENIQEWQWSKVHQATHEHALAKINILKKLLNVGPFPMVGGNETINNNMFDYTEDGIYKANAGPSTRRIIDFSDIENSYAILPTGQSGNFMSPYYKNQAKNYATGKFYKMLINKTDIKKSKNKLEFTSK